MVFCSIFFLLPFFQSLARDETVFTKRGKREKIHMKKITHPYHVQKSCLALRIFFSEAKWIFFSFAKRVEKENYTFPKAGVELLALVSHYHRGPLVVKTCNTGGMRVLGFLTLAASLYRLSNT